MVLLTLAPTKQVHFWPFGASHKRAGQVHYIQEYPSLKEKRIFHLLLKE